MLSFRPHLFIGSASEHLEYARAVQDNLQDELECSVWNQAVFQLSEYPLDSLTSELSQSDFGVFVLAPADLSISRGRKSAAPRDNVILELGFFAGHLGRKRTFILAPKGVAVHLPSDLAGLKVGLYESVRSDSNLHAALGPVCNEIRSLVRERIGEVPRFRSGLLSASLFSDIADKSRVLLRKALSVQLCFIHSRRWRENNLNELQTFLARPGTDLTVFLPDLSDKDLSAAIVKHFDDGPNIPGFISDAYRHFSQLRTLAGARVNIRRFSNFLSYSFYRFDNRTLVALYPNTALRQDVPAFEIDNRSPFGNFLRDDIKKLIQESKSVSDSELRVLASRAAT